jgi:hypothetical protein
MCTGLSLLRVRPAFAPRLYDHAVVRSSVGWDQTSAWHLKSCNEM